MSPALRACSTTCLPLRLLILDFADNRSAIALLSTCRTLCAACTRCPLKARMSVATLLALLDAQPTTWQSRLANFVLHIVFASSGARLLSDPAASLFALVIILLLALLVSTCKELIVRTRCCTRRCISRFAIACLA